MKLTSLALIMKILLSCTIGLQSSMLWAANEAQQDEDEIVQSKPDNDKENPLDNVDINIIQRGNKTIETHSINGIVYKVKVKPKNAPAYYFYDTDGDGSLDTRSNREFSNTTVQQWKIFQW